MKSVAVGRTPMSIYRTLVRFLGAGLLVSLLADPIAHGASATQRVVIAFAAFNERSAFLFVAKDQRFYTASATGAILGAMAGGLDLVFIAGLVNKLDGDFVVSPKIKSPSDLKGKIVGVDPKFARLRLEDMADDRTVRKLEREGLFK